MKIILQLLTIIIISGSSIASGTTNWVLLARSADYKYFYIDSNTLSYQLIKMKLTLQEEIIATAWFKIIPSKERNKSVSFAEKYFNEKMSSSTALIQTNCANSKLRVLVINIFDEKGQIAYRSETLTSKYEDIPPKTVFEDIKKIICQ